MLTDFISLEISEALFTAFQIALAAVIERLIDEPSFSVILPNGLTCEICLAAQSMKL